VTLAEIVAWTAASRRAQGLTEQIEDPAVLARIATLAFAGTEAGEGGGGRARTA
jgi:hypothetical protein